MSKPKTSTIQTPLLVEQRFDAFQRHCIVRDILRSVFLVSAVTGALVAGIYSREVQRSNAPVYGGLTAYELTHDCNGYHPLQRNFWRSAEWKECADFINHEED